MKKYLLSLLSLTLFAWTAAAQPDGEWDIDCDCDPNEIEWVCVTDDEGNLFPFDACFAECLGLEIAEDGDCDFDDGSGEEDDWGYDCDCDYEDVELMCVSDEYGYVFEIEANECILGCFGLEVADCDEMDDWDWEDDWDWDDDWGWEDDCDCDEEDYADYCVFDPWTGCVYELEGNECLFDCLGYEIIDCDDWEDDWEDEWEDDWNDCDCDWEDVEDYCVYDPYWEESFVIAGNECIIACWGLEIIDCEDLEDDGDDWEDDWEDEWSDCDCSWEDFDVYCVYDPMWDEVYAIDANDCLIECWGLEVVECEDIEDEEEWEEDCDCDWEDLEEVCVYDPYWDEVFAFEANDCIIECWGLEIIDCDEIEDDGDDWDWENDCDCDEEEYEDYCVFDPWSGCVYEMAGNDCLFDCLGYEIVDCDEWEDEWENDWTDCDCDWEDLEEYCVYDPYWDETFAFEANECIIECWGLEIIDCEEVEDDGDDWDDEWNDCDCDWEDLDVYCVYDEYWGDVYTIEANECIIECWGLEIIDCDFEDEDGEEDDDEEYEEDCDCDYDDFELYCVVVPEFDFIIEVEANECLIECWGLEIVDCNGDEDDDGEGLIGGIAPQSNATAEKGTSISNVNVFPNPTNKDFTLAFEAIDDMMATMTITNMSGQVVSTERLAVNAGYQNVEINAQAFEAGVYFVTLTTQNGAPQTMRVVKL